ARSNVASSRVISVTAAAGRRLRSNSRPDAIGARIPAFSSSARIARCPCERNRSTTVRRVAASISPSRRSPDDVTALYLNRAMPAPSNLAGDLEPLLDRGLAGQRLDHAVFIHRAHAFLDGGTMQLVRFGVAQDELADRVAHDQRLEDGGAAEIAGPRALV